MSKRVLITGSEGFTGRYVIEEFRRAGWEVWGAGLQPKPKQPQYLQIDLLKPETLVAIATEVQPDVVIHLAAMAFVAEDDANSFYQVNLIGTRNLLEVLSAAKSPPECTIIASSANVYGNSALEVLSEDSPTNPANDYAVSKLAMEYLAKTYMDRLGIVITRPFNYTGVGQSNRFLIPKIVEHFKARAPVIELGNIDVARDFSDVRDVAMTYRCLSERAPLGKVINICSGKAISLQECLTVANQLSGHDIQVRINSAFIRENEVRRLSGDRTKIDTLVGQDSLHNFEDTLGWMLSHG